MLLKQLSVVSQVYGFIQTAMKVCNSTSPVEAAVSIIDDCSHVIVRYLLKCSIFLTQVGLAVSSGGNPFAIAMAIGLARKIIE